MPDLHHQTSEKHSACTDYARPQPTLCVSKCTTLGEAQQEAPMLTRTFIMYLEPSLDAPAVRCLATVRNFLGEQIGYDESHLYPLHCSLTSFFDITCPTEASPLIDEVFEQCLKSALLSGGSDQGGIMAGCDSLTPLRKSDDRIPMTKSSPKLSVDSPCATQRGLRSFDNGKLISGTSFNVSTRVSTAASESRLVETEDGDEDSQMCSIPQGPFDAAGRSITWSASSFVSKTRVVRSRDILFQVDMKSSQGVTSPIPKRKLLNETLKLVHVTDDGSIILPIRASWLTDRIVESHKVVSKSSADTGANQKVSSSTDDHSTKVDHRTEDCADVIPPEGFPTRLKRLCEAVETQLRRVVPQVRIRPRNGSATVGIRPKAARHMTLLNNKGFAVENFEKQLASIARLLDKAACTGPRPLMWDIVVNEIKSWGSFQGAKTDDTKCSVHLKRHPCFAEPHDFVDVVRVTHVALTKY